MTTLSHVELGVLGPLQVRQYGLPVAVPGAKPRAVLTMLGLHGGSVVSADTLAELLWGADPPRTAAKALQTHISSLRRALGDGYVLTEGSGWALTTSEIDAIRYKLAARMGREAVAAGDAGQAVARFDEALALWRGVPELPDGPRGGSEKTRWIEGHAALVEDRADALLATGRAAEIVGELEAAIADAPLRERRWGQLMLALYRAGRQGEALGAYQRARSMLADELGVDPGPDLRRLETAIVAQDAALEIAVPEQLSVVTRAVTFLLTDIEGSTAAWEADADAMAAALARHDEIVEQVVTSRGGRLVKTRGEGDATFSVFDRPSGAASAAIELQEAIRHEPWALAEPMRIRVALHTGEVELRDGDYFGRTVNRAARLRSLAAGGQILCSGATAELVIDTLADDVVLADLGMRHLRNLARPEHVFELRLETTEDSVDPTIEVPPIARPVLPTVLAGPGPFVGRGPELEGLFAAWQSTLAAGARAMLIAGEPGVGKTRLAGEWSRQAYDQGAVVLYGRCDEDLGAAYQPFAEALRSLVPCVGANRLRGLRGIEALLPLVPGLTEIVPDLPMPSRSDPDTERYALFDAVVALLSMASASAPVVLILDDLHWAAKPTLLLLRHLLRFGEHARVQIVGTYRSTDLDRSHPLAAMLADLHRDGSASRIALSGLDADDVTAYVAEAGYDDVELARALASVTGGNPFFLIEALRHVDESGGRWDPSTLPQGVREAVSRRLSRLPAETNKALAAAAVVGSRFALDLVEQVVGEDLIDAFDEACKAGIVIEEPGGRYRFNHALVRQSLLAELASVRRMRLHQKIATTLEAESDTDDEMLAELAYHYFECAWAGNAAKAVEYCRRAADQAIERLAYEGAADLYDRALHALEELDDELPDRDALQSELLVARCEALLAAGDVGSAAGAVAQLQRAAGESVRLTAWGTCFDGQLSMLTNPDRLDEIESEVNAAAQQLAELDDAAGEANAHTVRAACLARLGRIADCETALDQALTAARRARDHRRVNAVLAGAPLAALWGPNPVPRAGGRCLDVVRLLRITTGSPVVEATSTRCQGVLDAMRGRAAAGRQLIDSARRALTELGMRHALLEVDQFAGIVEMVADDPASAEPHLRRAYDGFRRMGLDADTADTAALLARTYLALDRDVEADELCRESERLAGHALKPSIAWRAVRAQLHSRGGAHDDARRVAEEAVAVAERTDELVDHGDACLALASVLGAAGDVAGARSAAEQAVALYERKGAAALVEKARRVLGSEASTTRSAPETSTVEPENECVRTLRRVEAAVYREAWDEVEQAHARIGSIESRRKIVGFEQMNLPASRMASGAEKFIRDMRAVRTRRPIVAIRGERLALTRTVVGTADATPGAPMDEMLQLVGLDENGRIAIQVWFDVEDLDTAMAELDVLQAQFAGERSSASTDKPETLCLRAVRAVANAVSREAWDEVEQLLAPTTSVESQRKVVGFERTDSSSRNWPKEIRRYLEDLAIVDYTVVAVRGEHFSLLKLDTRAEDPSPGAPRDEVLELVGVDEEGRITLQVWFDPEDVDAAMAELDAAYVQFQTPRRAPLRNSASQAYDRLSSYFSSGDWAATSAAMAQDMVDDDRRSVVNAGVRRGRDVHIANCRAIAETGADKLSSTVVAIRGERLALCVTSIFGDGDEPAAFRIEFLSVVATDAEGRLTAHVAFDLDDFDAAFAELDARYIAGEAALQARTWSLVVAGYAAFNRREIPATSTHLVSIDHRRATAFADGEMIDYIRAAWSLEQDVHSHVTAVHRLDQSRVVLTHATSATSQDGFNADWRFVELVTFEDGLVSGCEIFDEEDIDLALSKFDELSRPARQLDSRANRVLERYLSHFPIRNWDAMRPTLAEDFLADDRRRTVNSGVRRGRENEIENLRAMAELGLLDITSDPIAVRGERLVLARHSFTSSQWAGLQTETIDVVELNDDGLIVAEILYDADDLDAALAELDARYLAGEAAAHAEAWSVIAPAYAALNRRETPDTTPDWVNIDHRRARGFAPGDMISYIRASWELTPDINYYCEAVHRLSDLGAVVTRAAYGTSQDGFDAEWREMSILTVDGGRISRCEMFDESDLEAALARFDELNRPTRPLENAASQADGRFNALFAERSWEDFDALLADDLHVEDRRRGLQREGRDRVTELVEIRAVADLGTKTMTSKVVAVRGERLVLTRTRYAGRDTRPDAFHTEILRIAEVDADGMIIAYVAFDLDDFEAALEELEARYLAGEAAAHSDTWKLVVEGYATLNERELPPTTTNWTNVDHRRARRFASGDLFPFIRASWDDTPDIRIFIAGVYRLTDSAALVASATQGRTREGFGAEWREVSVVMFDGNRFSRCEMYDEGDLDAAMARFDELNRTAPLLENDASRVSERFRALFELRDWDALAELYTDDVSADDRRRVFGGGARSGRDTEIANLRAMADVGAEKMDSIVLATRGRRLVLHTTHVSNDDGWEASFLSVLEINADGRIVAVAGFGADDVEAAFEDLDARYLVGEAIEFARSWSVVVESFAALNRHEIPPRTSDWVNIDHRRGTAVAPGDLIPHVRAAWELTPNMRWRIAAVYRLNHSGAVIARATHGTSEQGFDAEWRSIDLLMVDGDVTNRVEIFDETDLDAALAKFDALNQTAPQLDNAASRAYIRMQMCFSDRDWDGLAAAMTPDIYQDDHRRVVSAEARNDRESAVAEARAVAELGAVNVATTTIAVRGHGLALVHSRFGGHDQRPDAFRTESLVVVELNHDELISAHIMFEVDDVDAAFAELDSRYLAGEAAVNAHAWSVIAGAYAAVNRHELPAWTADVVNVDHRSATAFAPGDLGPYLRATWGQTPNVRVDIVAVHRLTSFGAVVRHIATGTTDQGFEGEWREITLSTIQGDRITRSEMFDDADLDAALARFDELTSTATRLENTASQVEARCQAFIAAGDWDAMAALLADDVSIDDRRRVVNAGLRRGQQVVIEDLRVGADIGLTHITPTALATRGERLTLRHIRYGGGDQRPEAGVIELVQIVEIDTEERISALVLFEVDDIEPAVAELDARYLKGEAARHARTWSAVVENCAALNQQLLPAPPEFVYVDRRRVASIGAADVREFFRAAWELTPDMTTFIETVYRLSDAGVVVSQVAQGTSRDGFYAEWRVVNLYEVDGDVLSRCEVFDGADLDAALARFDELSPAAPQLQNDASRMMARFQDVFRARDWDGMAELFSEDICLYDRRPVVGVEFLGRDATIANMRASADTGVLNVRWTVIATRGSGIALHRVLINGRDERPEAFRTEALVIAEVDPQNLVIAFVMFDLGDIDAAYQELEKRYIAGQAAAPAHAYTLIADAFAVVNRHELPTTTTPDFVSIDHRRPIAFAPGEMMVYLQATLNDAPEIRIDIEAVHRLSSCGVVVSHTWRNTSELGFDAEWRVITISMVEGGLISRCELFDEADLDAALARFDELSARAPGLDNVASRVVDRYLACFAARNWIAMAELVAVDMIADDRRRVVNAGIRRGRGVHVADMRAAAEVGAETISSNIVATRGARVALKRVRTANRGESSAEMLGIVEIDGADLIVATVAFDLDDIDAAFQELDARYLAGEAAAHKDTWSVLTDAYAALNRHQIPPSTLDWVNIDHRRGGSTFEKGDLATYIRASWEDSPENKIYVETVHRLSHRGAVVTSATRGVSVTGFYAEWRQVDLVMVNGNMLCRTELFDENELDEALARFDELSRPAVRLENPASRAEANALACFATRDWETMAQFLADDISFDDRRRVVNAGTRNGREAAIADARAVAELGGTQITSTVIATRGERLFLSLSHLSSRDQGPGGFQTESLCVASSDDDGRIAVRVVFDPDDIDAALEELDARYLTGEAAPYADTWSIIANVHTVLNRRERPATTTDAIDIDHRSGISFAPGDLFAFLEAAWELTPTLRFQVEAVHRLNKAGAVFTHVARGNSHDGFDAEWRSVNLLMVRDGMISRGELFDEDDLDVALARFDELSTSAQQLTNVAIRGDGVARDAFNRRDLDGYLATFAANAQYEDRRKGLRNAGPIDREFARGMLFTGASSWRVEIAPVALRGRNLALVRHICRDGSEAERPVVAEVLALVAADITGLICRSILFDPDDLGAAFEELESRYLAGEAAAFSRTWNTIVSAYRALSRRELPATTRDWVNIDHRRGTSVAPGEATAFLRAARELTPHTRLVIEAVHRLSDLGAVVTHVVTGTSHDGFEAEWREISLLGVESDLIARLEVFDEADLDAAVAKLDRISVPASLLDNTATRARAHVCDLYNRRDVEEFLAVANGRYEDRRKGLGYEGIVDREYADAVLSETPTSWHLEIEPVAIRGDHLALSHETFRDTSDAQLPITIELIVLTDVIDELVSYTVFFDPDDIDAAFAELNTRWIASGEVEHPEVVESARLLAEAYNRHDWTTLEATEAGAIYVNHRQLSGADPETISDHWSSIRALTSLIPDMRVDPAEILAHSGVGLVSLVLVKGTTAQGAAIELPAITLLLIDGESVARMEAFDADQRDLALARFHEFDS